MSMNCKKAEEYLVDYLYQELSANKTLEIEKHLRSCAHCTKTLESWRAIHRGYHRTAEEPQVAPYLKQKILIAAEEELARPASWKERLILGLKIATVPLAIFVLLLFLNPANKKDEIASVRQKPAAPQTVQEEKPQVAKEPLPNSVPERKQDINQNADKRRDQDVFADKVSAPKDAEKLKKDVYREEAGEKENAARMASGRMYNEPAAAAPAPSAPPQAEQQSLQGKTEEMDYRQKAAQVSSDMKNADESFQEAQMNLDQNNVKVAQEKYQEAISLDNGKSLANELHQSGKQYQSQGEYAKAILQYKLVQTNYHNYADMDDVLLRLGDSYAEIGQFDKALQTYKQIRSQAQQKVAIDRIRQLQKKQEAQEQLRTLGYVDQKKD
jgi:tetratricopeptide (TPR) repeat protein